MGHIFSELIRRAIVETPESASEVLDEGISTPLPDNSFSEDIFSPFYPKVNETAEIINAMKKFETAKRWLNAKEINPGYKPFSPRSVNCGTCAFALWKRLSGIDPNAIATETNIAPQDADMELITGLKVKYFESPEAIEKVMRAKGPGAHTIIGVNRNNGIGHWFNVIFDGKEMHTLDAQIGEVSAWPHDYGDVSEWCALI